jgi:hypothetical protein
LFRIIVRSLKGIPSLVLIIVVLVEGVADLYVVFVFVLVIALAVLVLVLRCSRKDNGDGRMETSFFGNAAFLSWNWKETVQKSCRSEINLSRYSVECRLDK